MGKALTYDSSITKFEMKLLYSPYILDNNITNFVFYTNQSDYNHIKTIAERAGSYMLINHFISMVDGLFLGKMWSATPAINLDLYPDLSNRLGLGGVKLTFGWK